MLNDAKKNTDTKILKPNRGTVFVLKTAFTGISKFQIQIICSTATT